MKHLFFLIAIVCFSFQFATVTAQENKKENIEFPKLDASPMDMAIYRNSDKEILARVTYSRPQKKGRELFGDLVPYSQVWRTGANESTEITLYEDLKIGDKDVRAGTYTLYIIPEKDKWTVIINRKNNTWGAYDYDESQDVTRFTVPVKDSPTNLEAFSMNFISKNQNADLLMGWGDKYVAVPFSTN